MSNGYIAGVAYEIYQAKYYFWLSNYQSAFNFWSKKTPSLPTFLENVKWYLAPATKPGKGLWIITGELLIFRACSRHESSSASNFWSKETRLSYFWTIPTPDQYGEKAKGYQRGLGRIEPGIVYRAECTRHFHIFWGIWISFQKSETMIRWEIRSL